MTDTIDQTIKAARNDAAFIRGESVLALGDETERLRTSLHELAGYAVTARTHNTPEWMHGLVGHLNITAQQIGEHDRAVYENGQCKWVRDNATESK